MTSTTHHRPEVPAASATSAAPPGLAAFLDLVGDDLGLDLGPGAATAPLAELPGWDSVHLLRLVVLMERESGRRIPVRRVLEAQHLAEIHQLTEDQA